MRTADKKGRAGRERTCRAAGRPAAGAFVHVSTRFKAPSKRSSPCGAATVQIWPSMPAVLSMRCTSEAEASMSGAASTRARLRPRPPLPELTAPAPPATAAALRKCQAATAGRHPLGAGRHSRVSSGSQAVASVAAAAAEPAAEAAAGLTSATVPTDGNSRREAPAASRVLRRRSTAMPRVLSRTASDHALETGASSTRSARGRWPRMRARTSTGSSDSSGDDRQLAPENGFLRPIACTIAAKAFPSCQ